MSASTSTACTPPLLNNLWPKDNKNDNDSGNASIHNSHKEDEQTPVRRLLDTLIKDHYNVFHIEYRGQPNVLARVLMALHELGASHDQIVQGYYNVFPSMVPLLLHNTDYQTLITPDTWQIHLGNRSYYQAYLAFFSDQVEVYGIDAAVKTFFIHGPLSASIASRLQPLVHLTFGVEYAMPHIVAQGLAYLATTYLDVTAFIMDTDDNNEAAAMENTVDPATLLFDLVAVDPRFAGRMEAADMAAYKLLLKSQGPLLRTYLRQCAHPTPADLVRLATDLVGTTTIRLAATSQLLDAARSIDIWPVEIQPRLSKLVLLAMLCTFIVERRPSQPPTATSAAAVATTTASWQQCADHVKAAANPTLVLLFQNLTKISKENINIGRDLLGLANGLVMNN